MPQQPYDLVAIRSELAASGTRFGASLEWHDTVESTMPIAWPLVEDSAIASGAAVVADEQTAGKGRQGRTWVAPPALALLVSFMLRRAECAVSLGRLHMAALLAIADLCLFAGIAQERIRCKWPNDVVLLDSGGHPHKVAGILVETRLADNDWASAVIGTGINVNQRLEDLPPPTGAALPATSLWLAQAERQPAFFDRSQLFVALCRALDNAFALPDAQILQRWQTLLWIPQGQVIVMGADEQHAGTILGADDAGALLLRDDTGVVHRLVAGDLSLRPYTR